MFYNKFYHDLMLHGFKSRTPGAHHLLMISSHVEPAFKEKCVGSRVIFALPYLSYLSKAIFQHDFTTDTLPGQACIETPDAVSCVSCGVGRHTHHLEDYVMACHRGKVGTYLQRRHAARTSSCQAIVYTREAYLNDPEITTAEAVRVAKINPSHVLVAVLASAGPKPPLTAWRFVANLSGRNNEALQWSVDTIQAKAKEIVDYYETWAVVAD